LFNIAIQESYKVAQDNENPNCIYKAKKIINFNTGNTNKLTILTEDKLKKCKSLIFPSLKGIEHDNFGTCKKISDFVKI